MSETIKRYSTTETASLIRKELKAAFSKVKFSVRSSSYSGGSSIRVSWTDGPTQSEVERVAGVFAGATFDGMTDMKSYHESTYGGERVRFAADFVFCDRKVSTDHLRRAVRVWNLKHGSTIPESVVVENGSHPYIDRTPETDAACDWTRYTVGEEIRSLAYRMRQDGIIVTRMNHRRPEPSAEAVAAERSGHIDRVAGELWQVAEEYHAGSISEAEWKTRNRELWDFAESKGIAQDVVTKVARVVAPKIGSVARNA